MFWKQVQTLKAVPSQVNHDAVFDIASVKDQFYDYLNIYCEAGACIPIGSMKFSDSEGTKYFIIWQMPGPNGSTSLFVDYIGGGDRRGYQYGQDFCTGAAKLYG
jgi:hypothetical protein